MKTTLLRLAAVLVLGVAGSAAAQPVPIVIKFSHVVAADTPKGRAASYFASLVEKRTRGRVKVEVYPNSELYKDSDELAALQKGSVQMLAPSLAKLGPLGVPEFEVFDVPYLFESYADAHRVTFGLLGRQLLDKLEPKGIVGVAYWDNGFKQMSANKPLRRPEDVKGLRMRVQPSDVLQAEMRTLGAQPKAIDFSEAYQALKTGVVDGTENPASNFHTQHMEDVQKYLTLTAHGYIGYAVIVNKPFWDNLPSDVRRVLVQAMREATIFENDIASEANNDALEAIDRSGRTQVIRLSPAERAQWRQALAGVRRDAQARVGKDLIQAIENELGRGSH